MNCRWLIICYPNPGARNETDPDPQHRLLKFGYPFHAQLEDSPSRSDTALSVAKLRQK